VIDVIFIWFSDEMLFTLTTLKKLENSVGAAKNKTLEQKRFFAQERRLVSC